MLHITFHFAIPLVIAWIIDKENFLKIWMILMLSMLIDVDHLLANPIYDADRCSIGFHPLHSFIAIAIYVLFLFLPKTRIFGIGLLIHISLDGIDCIFMGL